MNSTHNKKDAAASAKIRIQGNNVFKQNLDQEKQLNTLSFYTQSAALAPNDSEELALAYSNRSILLGHLQRYKNALVDIERALHITKSQQLKTKLLARKSEFCSLKAPVQSFCPKKEILLEKRMTASKEIPCASELVTIKFNHKYGRHIVATQDIRPGTVIAIEKAYAAVPNISYAYLSCAYCLNIAWNAIPCHQCTTNIFCSEKCKEEAWQEYHDIECSVICHFNFDQNIPYPVTIKTSVRSFIKSLKKEGLNSMIKDMENLENQKDSSIDGFFHNGIFQTNKFKSLWNLSRTQNFSRINETMLSYIVTIIVKFLNSTTTIFNKKTHNDTNDTIDEKNFLCAKKILIGLCLVLDRNSSTYQYTGKKIPFETKKTHESTLDNSYQYSGNILSFETIKTYESTSDNSVGGCISVFCSLFNHSCCPNVYRVNTCNQEIVIYTLTMIEKGQQLFITYGPECFHEKVVRQSILKKSYDFDCNCSICEDDCNISQVYSSKFQDEMFDDLMKAGMKLSTGNVLLGLELEQKNIYLEKHLNDISNLIINRYKKYTGIQTIKLYMCMQYIIMFFENVYGMIYDGPRAFPF